jgi:hypothetical protein
MQKQHSYRPGELEVLFEEEKISQYGGEIRIRHQKLRSLQTEIMAMIRCKHCIDSIDPICRDNNFSLDSTHGLIILLSVVV